MNKKQAPIGIFDSGIGGLTVASAITKAFPQESIVYFGDTAHLPYGNKSAGAVESYALGIAQFLMQFNCKMLVIACNTASAVAYDQLAQQYGDQLPVIDVITPLVEMVAKKNYKKVGVIATKATVRSDIYPQKLHALQKNIEVISQATGMLATMIEEGSINDEVSKVNLKKYLSYPDFENIEALLLACTHYPLIRPEIEAFYQNKVNIYDSIDAVVEKITYHLNDKELRNNEPQRVSHRFFVSDYTRSFEEATRIFYQKEVHLEKANWVEGNLHSIRTIK